MSLSDFKMKGNSVEENAFCVKVMYSWIIITVALGHFYDLKITTEIVY